MIKSGFHSRGISLLEVLITLVVLGVGLIAIARFQFAVLQDSSLAKQRTEAATYAQDTLEKMRDFTSLAGGANSYANIANTDIAPVPGATASNTAYNVQSTVNPAGCAVTAGSQCITTAITWEDKNGNVSADSSINLNTIIVGLDPQNAGNPPIAGGNSGVVPPDSHNDRTTKCLLGLLGIGLLCS